MRKGLFGICLSLVVAIVLLAVFLPGCNPKTKGTIKVQATLCGNPWPPEGSGLVDFTLTPASAASGSPFNGNSVPVWYPYVIMPGTWTLGNVSGGPAGAYLDTITPSATQSVSAGENTTFTLNFELNQDAAIHFLNWTVNGNPFQASVLETRPCSIIDAHFAQWVNGCVGYNVTMNETSWLSITQTAGLPATVVVVDDDCAVNKTPTRVAQKVSQVPSVDNVTRQQGYNITLVLKTPTTLDVHTQWQLVKCVNYTKSINWFGISLVNIEPGAHPCVLFELVLPMPGQFYQFTLQTSAQVALVGDTDANPANDATMGPPLTLIVDLTE
jgi:hypothetical protein